MTTNEQFQLFRSNIERLGKQVYGRHDSDVLSLLYNDCDYDLFLPMPLGCSQVLFWTGETAPDDSKIFTVDPVEVITHDTWDWGQFADGNDGKLQEKHVEIVLKKYYPHLDLALTEVTRIANQKLAGEVPGGSDEAPAEISEEDYRRQEYARSRSGGVCCRPRSTW